MTVLGDKLQTKLLSAAVSCIVVWLTKLASGFLNTPRLELQRSLLAHKASIRFTIISLEMLDDIAAF
jgi:hypothetical protein